MEQEKKEKKSSDKPLFIRAYAAPVAGGRFEATGL